MGEWFIKLDAASVIETWGDRRIAHFFPDDLLGGCFERTLCVDTLGGTDVDWVFTGPRSAVTVRIGEGGLRLWHRHYDSPGYAEIAPPKNGLRHTQHVAPTATIHDGRCRSITVRLDAKLHLTVLADDREVHRRPWPADLTRHQIALTQPGGTLHARLTAPAPRDVTVRVRPHARRQTMLGFGGTAAPAAYALLSDAGKRQWWRLVADYNLLIQREYPVGRQLRPEMDNWDWPESATPHYYGDNFPNSEVSDFEYVRKIHSLGGHTWFEFWHLPPWAEQCPDKYAAAVVSYCRASKEKAGAPPEVVGIQNEVGQTDAMWQRMTLALRRSLDAAGFASVKIHMSDDGHLGGAIRRARAVQQDPAAWQATDYAASHNYDYQDHLHDPDAIDATFEAFKAATENKPFLATEVCLNDSDCQYDSYRVALSMAQLYHKNLVLGDAIAVCYCWTLLNVVQPSYGVTRSLCVPDEAGGFVPRASSHQLRTFGAFSRHVRRGMTRVHIDCDDTDVLACAFADTNGAATVVAVNRSPRVAELSINWPTAVWTAAELCDPYHPNTPVAVSEGVRIPAGGIVTLTGRVD